jgi:SAM-dependent methyltransferase
MSSYTGRHARYYDTIYAEKPYAREAAFVSDLIRKHSQGNAKTLLELACGTGRHAFELEKLGYKITATDYSRDLLAVATENAKKQRSKVEFMLQDMRELDLPEKNFDAAYCLFDSIGYVQSNQNILQVLGAVRAHLRTGGVFVFEFWHAAAMLRNYEPRRERNWQLDDAQLKRISKTRLDVTNQTAQVTYEFEEKQADGTVLTLEETQVNRYFLVQEMALFLETAGCESLEWLPAYESGQINENTWHILAVARSKSV